MADGVNIVLCIIVAIAFLLIVAVNIYIVVHFQNEEDKNTAIFPKVVVVTTFTFICVSVLMMPMDVANQRTKRPDQAGIPMDILWQIVFISMAVLAFIVPFAFFYYEAEDPDSSSNAKQIKEGLKWNIVWLVAFFVPTLILWFTIGFAEIPIIKYTSPLRQFDGQPFPVLTNLDVLRDQLITYRVSFILYLISMITFCGTFVLVFFGGVGFAALPMDLINSFRTRPKQMSVVQYAEKKIIIGKRAASLLERGRALKQRFNNAGRTRPRGRREVREFNRFRTGVFMVEQEYKVLERSYNRGGAPIILYIIWDYVQLLLGIIGAGLSITWLLHIILFMAPRTKYFSLFLNKMFIDMDNAFGLFGTGAYAVWSFYLLWCVIKGNFKVGVRVPLFCTIHPMKVGETLMNAFLFNAFVLLLGAFAIIKFCATAFSVYARYTGIDILFNVGVNNLRYIKYFWWYYYFVMIGVAVIALVYLLILPSDRKAAAVDDTSLEELP